MLEFQGRFATEDACREYLFASRWPEGFVCPGCGDGRAGGETRRHLWVCTACGHQTSAGCSRRNHLVPVPAVGSIAQLNAMLLDACERDRHRRIAGRPATVAEQYALERPTLRALPSAAFDANEVASVRVDA
jgi:hypothetical protein